MTWQSRRGKVCQGPARPGMAGSCAAVPDRQRAEVCGRSGMVRQSWAGLSWQVLARYGGQSRSGMARPSRGMVRQSGLGPARFAFARYGMDGRVKRGPRWQSRRGSASRGMDRTARHGGAGTAWPGGVSRCGASRGLAVRHGSARLAEARRGEVWQSRRVRARRGRSRLATVRHGAAVWARHGNVGPSSLGFGAAVRQGLARPRRRGMARPSWPAKVRQVWVVFGRAVLARHRTVGRGEVGQS